MGYSNSIEKGTATMCQNDILSTTGILANFGTFVAGAENGKTVLLHPNGDELSSQPGDCSITRENPTDKDVIWEIGKVAIGSEWCYSALKDAYRVDSTAIADLTQVPEARKAIINYNITSAARSVVALALLGNTSAALQGLKGCDGVIKRALAAVATKTARRTAIDTNTDAAFATVGTALKYLKQMLIDAPADVTAANSVILCTQKFYMHLMNDIEAKYPTKEMNDAEIYGTNLNLRNLGVRMMQYNGYTLIGCPTLDNVTRLSAAKGDTTSCVLKDHPYFAMFVNKDNIGFGSNGNKSLDGGNLASVEAKINYDAASRKVISDIDFTLGTSILDTDLMQVLY